MQHSYPSTSHSCATRPFPEADPRYLVPRGGALEMHDEDSEHAFLYYSRHLYSFHPMPPRRWAPLPRPRPQYRLGYAFDYEHGEWRYVGLDAPQRQATLRVREYKHEEARPVPTRGVRRPSEEPYPRETKRSKPSPPSDTYRAAKSPLSAHDEAEDGGDTEDDAEEPARHAAAKRPLKRSGTGSSIINPQFAKLSINGRGIACLSSVGEVQEQFSTLRLAA